MNPFTIRLFTEGWCRCNTKCTPGTGTESSHVEMTENFKVKRGLSPLRSAARDLAAAEAGARAGAAGMDRSCTALSSQLPWASTGV